MKNVLGHAAQFLEMKHPARYVSTMATGRPIVPNRAEKSISTRLRKPVDKIVRAEADALNMPYGEYVSYLVALQKGLPEHAPPLPNSEHEQGEINLKSA